MTARPTARPIATPLARPIAGAGEGGSAATPLLLDTYTGAAAAYSLRKLRTAYAGACIRVRRSTDNTEQDVGFVGNAVDTAGLLSFCGASDGFVTTWYDQSGNGVNATKGTTTLQPQIVAAGVLQTDGTQAALNFATNRELDFTIALAAPFSIFAVATVQAAGTSYQRLLSGTPDTTLFFGALNKNFTIFFGSGSGAWNDVAQNTPATAIGSRARLAVVSASNVATPYINGVAQNTKNATMGAVTSVRIGRDSAAQNQSWNSTVQEVIVYSLNQSSNVAAIQFEQGGFYV